MPSGGLVYIMLYLVLQDLEMTSIASTLVGTYVFLRGRPYQWIHAVAKKNCTLHFFHIIVDMWYNFRHNPYFFS